MSFSNKRKEEIPICCDDYLDLYDSCNIGCEMCKFNSNVKVIKQKSINYDSYYNKKVLVSYKTDPYALKDYNLVEKVIKKLHDNNCKIVFLTRRVNSLIKQLDLFNELDYVGVSLSENCSKNSKLTEILLMLEEAKRLNIRTWISLEPVLTSEFANQIIRMVNDDINLIRVGKDDLLDYNWNLISKKITTNPKVYLKM